METKTVCKYNAVNSDKEAFYVDGQVSIIDPTAKLQQDF